MRIETIEQYLAVREAMEPIIVQGKTHKIAIPCANTLVIKRELVIANTYNPNSVPDDKMDLLSQSIIDNGFAFPVVTIYDPDQQAFVIIDGFHRFMIAGYDYLGLDLETIHRYKQLTGIADLFKNAQYSMSWSIVEVDDAA